MFCQQCGTEIPEGQNVCPGCYAPVRKSGLLSRILSRLLGGSASSGGGAMRSGLRPPSIRMENVNIVERVQNIRIRDPQTGEERVYESLEDAPPEIRQRIEDMRAQAKLTGQAQTFTIRDAAGNTQTYHSVEEMPPHVREIYEQIREQRGLNG